MVETANAGRAIRLPCLARQKTSNGTTTAIGVITEHRRCDHGHAEIGLRQISTAPSSEAVSLLSVLRNAYWGPALAAEGSLTDKHMKKSGALVLAALLLAGPAFPRSVGPGTGIGPSGSAAGTDNMETKNKTTAGTSGAKSNTGAAVSGANTNVNSDVNVNKAGAAKRLNNSFGSPKSKD